jgi:hypothetical protein
MTSAPDARWFSTTYDKVTSRRLSYYHAGKFVQYDATPPEMDASELTAWLLSRAKHPVEWVPCDVGLLGEAGGRAIVPSLRMCSRAADLKPGGWLQTDDGSFWEASVLKWLGSLCVDPAKANVPWDHQELLKYDVGGFMASHKDRLRGPDHVGTLLLVVPSPDLEGGQLVVEDEPMGEPGRPYVVFIPVDAVHRVDPVTKGVRYVGKASVFGVMSAAPVAYSPLVFED